MNDYWEKKERKYLRAEGGWIQKQRQLLELTKEFTELEKAGMGEYREVMDESADYYRGLIKLLWNRGFGIRKSILDCLDLCIRG